MAQIMSNKTYIAGHQIIMQNLGSWERASHIAKPYT